MLASILFAYTRTQDIGIKIDENFINKLRLRDIDSFIRLYNC